MNPYFDTMVKKLKPQFSLQVRQTGKKPKFVWWRGRNHITGEKGKHYDTILNTGGKTLQRNVIETEIWNGTTGVNDFFSPIEISSIDQ